MVAKNIVPPSAERQAGDLRVLFFIDFGSTRKEPRAKFTKFCRGSAQDGFLKTLFFQTQ